MKEQEFIAAADACIAASKVPAGIDGPKWQPGRDPDELRVKLPLEINGELSGSYLLIMAYPDHHDLKFRFCVEVGGKVIDRLDFESDETHANTAGFGNLIHGPHWHAWKDNRHLSTAVTKYDKLPIAVEFIEARKFDASLRWYCKQVNIVLNQHGIEFPAPQRLL